MAGDIATRRHRDGDRTQQNTNQTREAEEAACAIYCALDLRTRVRNIAQALTPLLVRTQPGLEGIDRLTGASEQHGVTDTTSGLNESGHWQVGRVHEQCWSEISKRAALVRPRNQDMSDPKCARADC